MFLNKQTIIKQLGISNNFFRRLIKELSKKGYWQDLKKDAIINNKEEQLFNMDIILRVLKEESFNNQKPPVEFDPDTQSHLNYLINK
jgi:hypothetical protein